MYVNLSIIKTIGYNTRKSSGHQILEVRKSEMKRVGKLEQLVKIKEEEYAVLSDERIILQR